VEPTKSDAVRWGSGHGVVVLLALAAIVAAIIGARASLLGIDASDGWQQSVEDEQRRGSILMWDVRSVYGDKGELAFAIAIEEIRAAGLLAASDAAAPDIAARLLAEAQICEGVCGSRSNPITRFAPIRSIVSEVSDHPGEAVAAVT